MGNRTFEFATVLRASPEMGTAMAPPRPVLTVGAPPEFGGDPAAWSPEHLLLVSLSTCFWTTFQALAARRGVDVREISCRASATVEKTASGLQITAIRLAVDLEVRESSLHAAQNLVGETERRCLISRALSVPVSVQAVVTSTPTLAEEAPLLT